MQEEYENMIPDKNLDLLQEMKNSKKDKNESKY